MARRKKHEEHGHHEAWAIPYADLMTLLLAFFVVMYAISTLNEGKYRVLADALTAAFGGAPRTINPVQVGNHQLQGADHARPSPILTGASPGPSAPSPAPNPTLLPALASHMRTGVPVDVSDRATVQRAQRQLGNIAARLEQALAPLVDARLITIRRAELWLEVEINSDILFDTGSAALDGSARDVVTRLADVLRDSPNPVRVEGYTDDRPINTVQFPSNWELSAARAASGVHLFAASGVVPQPRGMVGYGEHRPRADNLTEEGRNRNRRVVLIVLAAPEAGAAEAGPQAPVALAVKSGSERPIAQVATGEAAADGPAAAAGRTTGGSD